MDPYANYHQKCLTDIDWLNYFNLLDQLPFRDETLECYYTNQVSLNGQDQNYVKEWWEGDLPMLNYKDDQSVACHEAVIISTNNTDCTNNHGGRKNRRSIPLELEEIEKHFEKPITMAAKELNVGLTMLKKRCRELNIKRWPHRKLKSLKSLIHNVKEYGLIEEVEKLEEQKKMIKKLPEMKLNRRTMKLRQACFKATYKKRRLIGDVAVTWQ